MADGRPTQPPRVAFPHLDGLRFFCFLAVFLLHAFYTESKDVTQLNVYYIAFFLVRNGSLGVNFFFVLSGFLITYLLLTEKGCFGRIHVAHFYARRVLRIWPLYFACVAFGFLAFPLLKRWVGLQPAETANPLMYALFLGNFDMIRNGLPDASSLGVLWSVAVEEQFYLVWPLLLSAAKRGRELWVLLGVLCASVAFRATQTGDPVLRFHTLGLVGDMAVGGLIAYLAIQFPSFTAGVVVLPRWTIGGLYAATTGLFLVDVGHYLAGLDRLVPALLFGGIILEQNHSAASFFKLGRLPVISRLGQLTYGMYCLHPLCNVGVIQAARLLGVGDRIWHVLLLIPLTALSLTIALSALSYRYLEAPFLRLKNRLRFIPRD